MIIQPDSFELLEQPETTRFYREVFEHRVYSLDVCLDIGANVGLFTHWAYPFFKKIYSIEALPDNFSLLEKNVEKNKLERVSCFNYAIGGNNEQRKFTVNYTDGGNKINEQAPDQYTLVQGKTLATFMNEQKIDYVDLIKIDIEGGEVETFMCKDFEEVAPRISMILGEHYSGPMLEKLSSLGFHIDRIDELFRAKKR